MDNKLSIQDLATILTDSYGMDAKSSLTFVKTVFEIVEEFIAKDKLVKIKGFGTFKLISVSDRESVNVNTGERIVIAGHSKLTFTPDAALKDAVNRPFADFETTPLNEGTSIEDMERFPVSSTIMSELVPAEETQYFDETSEESSLKAQEEPADNTADSLQDEVAGIDADDTMASSVDAVDGSSEETAIGEEEKPSTREKGVSAVVIQNDEPVSQGHSLPKDNSAYPMSSESVPEPSAPSSSGKARFFYILLTILLVVISYICGHYRVLDMLNFTISDDADSQEPPLVEVLHHEPNKDVNLTDTIPADSIVQDSLKETTSDSIRTKPVPEEDYEEIAKYFPQVPNGDYLIIGDAGKVHHMQVGETLYRIAGKELGSQDHVRYLIVFNDFEDPNIIHTGDPIRIPKMVHKVTKEIIPQQ